MDALLERLSAGQLVAVFSILVGGIVALAMIYAITKYQFQALTDDTQLRREKLQGELALRERVLDRAARQGASLESLIDLDVSPPVSPKPTGCCRG